MTDHASGAGAIIRAYRPSDRDAVRDIACRTAFRNRGFESLVPDAELFADYWTRYYTDYEPRLLLVAVVLMVGGVMPAVWAS